MDHRTSKDVSAASGQTTVRDDAPFNLHQFCGDGGIGRPWLSKPFRFDSFSFATNGHIIIKVPAREGDVPPEKAPEKLEKHLASIFARAMSLSFAAPGPVVLPPAEPPLIEECSDCDGRGKDHDCPDCECVCLSCNGTGENIAERRVSTDFGGALFSLEYVRQIIALPGLEIASGSSDFAQSQPMLFRFNGGEGALMPLRKKYPEHVEIEPSKDSPIT